jgi:hypothetical protein
VTVKENSSKHVHNEIFATPGADLGSFGNKRDENPRVSKQWLKRKVNAVLFTVFSV